MKTYVVRRGGSERERERERERENTFTFTCAYASKRRTLSVCTSTHGALNIEAAGIKFDAVIMYVPGESAYVSNRHNAL